MQEYLIEMRIPINWPLLSPKYSNRIESDKALMDVDAVWHKTKSYFSILQKVIILFK